MFRSLLCSTALLIWFSPANFGQEISLDALPKEMRRPIANQALYRLFLQHVAVFERQAEREEARGTSDEAFRNHFVNQFGLTSSEYRLIADIALDFDNQFIAIRSQQRAIAIRFRNQEVSGARSIVVDLLPPLPSELRMLHDEINAVTAHSRDRVRAALGAARIAQLESALHRRDRFYLSFSQKGGSQVESAESEGFTYGYTSIDLDPITNQVTAYARTDMDGTLLPYYEPEVSVPRVTGLDSLSGKRGSDKEYSSFCWKPALDTAMCKFSGSSAPYQIFAGHSLRLLVPDPIGKRWIDYANYEFVASLDLLDEFEIPFFGPGPPHSVSDQSFLFGQTWMATW